MEFSFKTWLEMAIPKSRHLKQTYYHGTPKEKDGLKILVNGIEPPDLTIRKKNWLTPLKGKVYITPSLEYAVIIGGVKP